MMKKKNIKKEILKLVDVEHDKKFFDGMKRSKLKEWLEVIKKEKSKLAFNHVSGISLDFNPKDKTIIYLSEW